MSSVTFPLDLLWLVAQNLQDQGSLGSLSCLSRVSRLAYRMTMPILYHTFTMTSIHTPSLLCHFRGEDYVPIPTGLGRLQLGCYSYKDTLKLQTALQKEMEGSAMVEYGTSHPLDIAGSARVVWMLRHV